MREPSDAGHDLPMAPSGCSLDGDGLVDQLDRYRRLGGKVKRIKQHDLELLVWFDADVDLHLVRETIAIERQCCSFFILDYDPSDRRLSITVADPHRLDALGALRAALGGAGRAPRPD